ncbi:hypothetical protein [Alicyclobacillus sp. SO9]|uniref:hypothetical protein n=1 Tax=Alicyclobacillus sp. SO9 TaxID=2665646 RepID=UPI0018E8530F|nr:hypothetical protein [Alicyclobacillus sp. SO9]QQE78343.1 hypothetical protein GI364_21095 [Alicyclobacillus sp. SO9]
MSISQLLGVPMGMMMASLGTYTYLGYWLGKTYGLSVDSIGGQSWYNRINLFREVGNKDFVCVCRS